MATTDHNHKGPWPAEAYVAGKSPNKTLASTASRSYAAIGIAMAIIKICTVMATVAYLTWERVGAR